MPRPKESLEDLHSRFVEKYVKSPNNDCWLWIGSEDGGGTSRLATSLRSGHHQSIAATHISWFLAKHSWPTSRLYHSCPNRNCVNPTHLVESSIPLGDSRGSLRLSPSTIATMQAEYFNSERRHGLITKFANRHGVAHATIQKALRGPRLDLKPLRSNPDRDKRLIQPEGDQENGPVHPNVDAA